MTVQEINPAFYDYVFDWDSYFYVNFGGYGSSKSYNTAIKLILKMLEEKRTILVVRAVHNTHKDSTYSLLNEVIDNMGARPFFDSTKSPIEIRARNGGKIIFRGLDSPERLKSINDVSIIWMEEATEASYDSFKELIGRLRHPTLSLHMLLSFNPVGLSNWVYKRFFFDSENGLFNLDDKELYEKKYIVKGDVSYMHSNAEDNLFLPESYVKQLDEMKDYDIDLWRVARLGHFGTNGKKVLPMFTVATSHEEVMEAIKGIRNPLEKTGLDFGFVESYNALSDMVIDHENKILYIFDEYYNKEQTDIELAEGLERFKGKRIKADHEPKTIKFFKQQGFRMKEAYKFPGSRIQYTKKMRRFKKIVCSPKCKAHISELKDLVFKVDRQGEIIEDQFNIDPHTFSAMWYGTDDYEVSDLKGGTLRTGGKLTR